MASITIRQLGDDLKQRLRLRAARNGRSMEDEARTILRDAASLEAAKIEARAEPHQRAAPRGRVVADTPARAAARPHATGTQHILLIIGGGIAAYKALDLILRPEERGAASRTAPRWTRRAREGGGGRARPASGAWRSRSRSRRPWCRSSDTARGRSRASA